MRVQAQGAALATPQPKLSPQRGQTEGFRSEQSANSLSQ
jgi:hypothetical protein